MSIRLSSGCVFLALIGVAFGSIPEQASAVTVEVARKCEGLMAKAFPLREPGNPAAGNTKGNGREAQSYFEKCVANGGNVDDNAAKQTK